MKDEYLKRLEELLEENEVKNKEEILKKYQKRYEFGLESDLSDEEIENMLGKPEDVVNKFKEETEEEKTTFKTYDEVKSDYKKNYNLVVKTVGDDIYVVKSADDLVHLEFENVDIDAYDVKNDSESGVIVKYLKTKFFGLNRRKSGKITIKVPEGKTFDLAEISTTSGDHNIDRLTANTISFSTVSGDADIHYLKANYISISTVSGDYEIDKIDSEKCTINTVSGDAEINEVVSKKITLDSVSGDISINKTDCENFTTNSVSGDIKINNEKHKNIVRSIKEKF
ncbi:MAG: DUF4097 family beta strand repeat protein [Acholeplasmatales bacterium]|nr:DUF4097 family beta strand repeat protein [Acholeplasmatales bacterium]